MTQKLLLKKYYSLNTIKKLSGLPACVTISTAEQLIERGWGL